MGIFQLPAGYREIKTIHMKQDKKAVLLINGLAIAIMGLLFIAGLALVPLELEFKSAGILQTLLRWPVLLLFSVVLYAVGHEGVHGILIKQYAGEWGNFGFTGVYAYAGSDAYFYKRAYIVIALAPVVVFGVLFLLLNIFLPREYFWFFYFLQICNLSGAAGDYYVTCVMRKLPSDTLAKDSGVSVALYCKE